MNAIYLRNASYSENIRYLFSVGAVPLARSYKDVRPPTQGLSVVGTKTEAADPSVGGSWAAAPG